MKKKKKANEMPPTSIEESLPHTLRLHGAAFMSMFEDIGDEGRREVGTGTDQDRETGPAPAAAKDADAADAADAAKETAGKKSRKKNKKRRALDTPAMANPTSHPRVARNVDEMDAIFGSIKNGDTGDEDKGNEDGEADDSRQGRKSSAKKKHKGKPNKSTSSASIPDAGERERERGRQQLEEELRRKIGRERFMASDTDSMLSFDEEAMLAEAKKRIDRSQTAGRGGGFDKRKDMEEFKAIRREIQSFGTSRWGDSRPRLSRFPAFFAFLVVLADARMDHVRNVRKRRVSSHAPCATRRRPASVPEFFWRRLRPFILERHIGS